MATSVLMEGYMGLGSITDRNAVLKAIEECDSLGREAFLSKYGFGTATGYNLLYKEKAYDSKAIIGVAHGYQFPALGPLKAEEFSGGLNTVRRRLEKLGFTVEHIKQSVSFEKLSVGQAYTRPELAKIWNYKSYEAISRGAVTPSGTPYVILFITREKQPFLTQYADALEAGILEIDGEKNHTADDRIINASGSGHEIHLFYRERHHMPFTYHGKATLNHYEKHTDKPSRFRFAVGESSAISDSSLETEEITHGITDDFVGDPEGKKKVVQHVQYERSPKNRRKAIEIHGTICKACGFNFDTFYNPKVARKYIEIHHVKSVSVQEGKPINPAEDLMPLCSNCHSMAHRERGKILSLAEIKALIRERI